MNSFNGFLSRLSLPILITALLSLSVSACGNVEKDEQALKRGEYTPSDRFWTENQGIGADWYSFFFGRQAGVSPYRFVYAIEGNGGKTSYLSFNSYTNPRDEWGYISFYLANGASAPTYLESSKNLYNEPVCVQLDPASFVPCEGDNVDLFLLGTKRPYLDISVNFVQPTVYVLPKDGRKVYAIEASTIKDVNRANKDWKKGLLPLNDAYADHSKSRIARAVEGRVELTANIRGNIVAWQMNRSEGGFSSIGTLCSAFNFSPSPLVNGVKGSIDLSPIYDKTGLAGDASDEEAVYGVDLCQGKLERIENGAEPWVRAKNGLTQPLPYDILLFRTKEGKLEPLLGPEAISWSYGIEKNVNDLEQAKTLKLSREEVSFARYI